MDTDLRNVLILVGIVIMAFLLFLSSCSYQIHTCRVEAIKAGMKAEDISSICQNR
jgi:FtsZ-interacting cell division protein ZipA